MTCSPKIHCVVLAVAVGFWLAGCAPQPAAPTQGSMSPAAPAANDSTSPGATTAVAGDTPLSQTPVVEQPASEPATATTEQKPPPAAFYSVGSYDEGRDPAADLAMTIQRATAENKRILIQVGGEWCIWCHRISEYMETNAAVRHLVDDHFVVMKVTYPSEKSEAFLEQYPKVAAYPHLFVLAPDGKFLHSQGTSELEAGKSYNEEVFCKFLTDWKL